MHARIGSDPLHRLEIESVDAIDVVTRIILSAHQQQHRRFFLSSFVDDHADMMMSSLNDMGRRCGNYPFFVRAIPDDNRRKRRIVRSTAAEDEIVVVDDGDRMMRSSEL